MPSKDIDFSDALFIMNPEQDYQLREHQEWIEDLRDTACRNFQNLGSIGDYRRQTLSDASKYVQSDVLSWLSAVPENSIHAIVTDPPYGVLEYEQKDHQKLRSGKGGVWRIPPAFDGAQRQPLPRFTVLSSTDKQRLQSFFNAVAFGAYRALVPGGHVLIASNPLLSTMTFNCFSESGFEKRGEVIRLVQTMRGGDKPKGSEDEFEGVSVMARSCWEPWGMFRKPIEGTVAENLRAWGTGGLRRKSTAEPFKDVILCSPTRGREKEIAPHPSLKPQRFLRQIVHAFLPLGIGIVYDPFAGGGSTLAAAEHCGYLSIGTDRDTEYYEMAGRAFAALVRLEVKDNHTAPRHKLTDDPAFSYV